MSDEIKPNVRVTYFPSSDAGDTALDPVEAIVSTVHSQDEIECVYHPDGALPVLRRGVRRGMHPGGFAPLPVTEHTMDAPDIDIHAATSSPPKSSSSR